jgi:hypothetical protein
LLQQKQRLGKSTSAHSQQPLLQQSNSFETSSVEPVSSLQTSTGTGATESSIEERLSAFRQRFKDGSAPTHILSTFERRKVEKKAKVLEKASMIAAQEVQQVPPRITGEDDDIEKDQAVDTSLSNKLKGAPSNWRPRERKAVSNHCADLKRGICSVVSCEEGRCGCEGCPSNYLDHCCEVMESGKRRAKVGPRVPLRVQ